MLISRRAALALAVASSLAPGRQAEADDPRMGPRRLGPSDAKVTVAEYFSLTCTHCAAFQRETFPQVRAQLIDTGKIAMIYHDFPLDQVALVAAMVARALPASRYEAFISALFASQDRWAFARGVNSTDELWKMAALAGMNRATFDATVADEAFKKAIVGAREQAETQFHVDSTPTFIVNGPNAHDKVHAGELTFDAFGQLVAAAT